MMQKFLQNILQLFLSPAKGWEDVSASCDNSDAIFKHSFVPLAVVVSLSEFIRLLYPFNVGFLHSLELAIALFGSFFMSFFFARIIFQNYLPKFLNGELNQNKLDTLIIYGLSLLLIIELIDNILPAKLTLVKFLPIFVALILYKGARYIDVRYNSEIAFMVLASLAIIVCPLFIFFLLELIIS